MSNPLQKFLFRLTQTLRGSDAIDILHGIEEAPWEPRDVVRQKQFQALKRLLRHAEANVPYYRRLFSKLGITSRDIQSIDDFKELPILTKDIIRSQGDQLVRDDISHSKLFPKHSGGSTGEPLSFYHDQRYIDASRAGVFRNFQQVHWQPGDMIAFFWGWDETLNDMSRWEFAIRQRLRRKYQFDPFDASAEEMERWLDTWRRIGPTIAHGYASTITQFAEFARESGKAQLLKGIRGVFTTAEKLHSPQRALMEEVFEARVFDCYGSSEVQNIAAECPHGSMHIMSDYVVLETMEDSGPHNLPEDSSPLLVTSLWNYAMPFIRYRNEDCGRLLDGKCDCGRSFPLMDLRIARVSDQFLFPNGRVLHGTYFTALLFGSEGIEQFQFHQRSKDQIDLLVVPSDSSTGRHRQAIQSAISQIHNDSDNTVTVDVKEVESIPRSRAGKHRYTRSDITSDALRPTRQQ